MDWAFNPLNAKLNPIRHLLALLGAHHSLHVSRYCVKYNGLCLLYDVKCLLRGTDWVFK
jgi:hypothetical protein